MPMTNFEFKPGQRCMAEVHSHNHPNGVWEGVVDTVTPYDQQGRVSEEAPPLYVVTARFIDPRMLLEAEGGAFTAPASYYGKPITAHVTLWPIETRRLFDALRQRREDEAARSTYYVAREKVLLDALRVVSKEAVAHAVAETIQAAVKAAVREAFDAMSPRLKDPSEFRQSLDDDGKTAVWSVREDTREGRVAPRTAREVEVHGMVEGVHRHEDPLPCTYGRGVAFLVTTAAIRCYLDPGWTELPLEDDVYAGTVNQTESAPAPQTERDEDP